VRGRERPQTITTYVVAWSRGLTPKCNTRNIQLIESIQVKSST
jgi:hypothetical protein